MIKVSDVDMVNTFMIKFSSNPEFNAWNRIKTFLIESQNASTDTQQRKHAEALRKIADEMDTWIDYITRGGTFRNSVLLRWCRQLRAGDGERCTKPYNREKP